MTNTTYIRNSGLLDLIRNSSSAILQGLWAEFEANLSHELEKMRLVHTFYND
jgi:hypothetical protein